MSSFEGTRANMKRPNEMLMAVNVPGHRKIYVRIIIRDSYFYMNM